MIVAYKNVGKHMYALKRAFALWRLFPDGELRHTPTSLLQPVLFQAESAMLKVALCEEERRGAALMRWWNGDAAARVLAHDNDALLLERIDGGALDAVVHSDHDDDTASRIICEVALRLHAPRRQPLPDLMPLAQWFSALTLAAATHGGIIREAASIAEKLLAAPQEAAVLHGDLHHGNILNGGQRGWLAIDPKGLFGERGFDFANIFCNPEYAIATAPGRLERQARIVCEAAGLERERLLHWIVAWAGLSAVWHLEDGGTADTVLAVAEKAFHTSRQ